MKKILYLSICFAFVFSSLVSSAFALESFNQAKYDSIQFKPLKYLYGDATKGSMKGFALGSKKEDVLKKLKKPYFEKMVKGKKHLVYVDFIGEEIDKVVVLTFKKDKLDFCSLWYAGGTAPDIKVEDVRKTLGEPDDLNEEPLVNDDGTKEDSTSATYGSFMNVEKKVQMLWGDKGKFQGYFMGKMTGEEYLETFQNAYSVILDIPK